MREWEKPRTTARSIFSKARHPAAQTSSSFSENGWSVHEIRLFLTGKSSIDRWMLCSPLTAQCKVMWERQIRSTNHHKKVCSCLRSIFYMRTHELHWLLFNTFPWTTVEASLWETFNKLQLNPGISIQPCVTFPHHPGSEHSHTMSKS